MKLTKENMPNTKKTHTQKKQTNKINNHNLKKQNSAVQ